MKYSGKQSASCKLFFFALFQHLKSFEDHVLKYPIKFLSTLSLPQLFFCKLLIANHLPASFANICLAFHPFYACVLHRRRNKIRLMFDLSWNCNSIFTQNISASKQKCSMCLCCINCIFFSGNVMSYPLDEYAVLCDATKLFCFVRFLLLVQHFFLKNSCKSHVLVLFFIPKIF